MTRKGKTMKNDEQKRTNNETLWKREKQQCKIMNKREKKQEEMMKKSEATMKHDETERNNNEKC